MYRHTHTYTRRHTYAHTRTHAHTIIHTYIHTYTHKHACTHPRTHTHTLTWCMHTQYTHTLHMYIPPYGTTCIYQLTAPLSPYTGMSCMAQDGPPCKSCCETREPRHEHMCSSLTSQANCLVVQIMTSLYKLVIPKGSRSTSVLKIVHIAIIQNRFTEYH